MVLMCWLRECLRESLRSLNSHSPPAPIVSPMGAYRSTYINSIKRFFARKFFLVKKKNFRQSAEEMPDEAGKQAWLANLRAQFVGDGEGGYILWGGYQVAQAETGGPGAASAVLQPLPVPRDVGPDVGGSQPSTVRCWLEPSFDVPAGQQRQTETRTNNRVSGFSLLSLHW